MSEGSAPPLTIEKIKFMADLGCWVVLFACVVQLMLFIFGALAESKQYGVNAKGFEHVDFINTYMSGTLLASADRKRIYDPQVQLEHYNQVISPAKTEEHCFYQYPPYVFLMAAPLTRLNLRDAFLVFDISTALAGLAGLFLVIRANPKMPAAQGLVLLIAMLGSFPSLDNLRDGQFAWAFVALFGLYFWSYLRKRDLIAGITLGIIAIKPHYFIFLLIGAALGKRFKLLSLAMATLLTLICLSGQMLGWDNVFSYPATLRSIESASNTVLLVPERMISLRGPASIFFPREVALYIGSGFFLIGLAGTVYYWYCAIVKKLFSVRWAMALTVLILLIASPHTLVYDAVLIALCAALTLPTMRLTQAFAATTPSLRIWQALLLAYPLVSWLLMIVVPKLMKLVFANSLESTFSVNGTNYGLVSFPCFLLVHILLFVAGSVYVFSGQDKEVEAV